MKKFGILRLIFACVCSTSFNCLAQTAHQIIIAVQGIDYDDPSFGLLKESIQKNKKVSAFTQSFNEGTATLTLSYLNNAQTLWSEVPQTTKDFFKVRSIEDYKLTLSSKNAATNNSVSSNSPGNSSNAKDDDCRNCYWDICHYDVVKSFGGKLYKGINFDNGTFYYNCENGIVLQKVMTVNGYGTVTGIQTDTLLITGGPVGTQWGVRDNKSENDLLSAMMGADLSFSNKCAYTLVAKNITTEVEGKKYDDVVVVNFKGVSTDPFFGTSLNSINHYYAKGIGLIRTDTLNFYSNPVEAINKKSDKKSVYSAGSVVKNGIDESIVGLWKYHEPKSGKDMYYRFNENGTFDFYYNSVAESNKLQGTNYWKIEGRGYEQNGTAVIDLTWSGGNTTVRYELQKKNDPATHRPALDMQGAILVSEDKNNP